MRTVRPFVGSLCVLGIVAVVLYFAVQGQIPTLSEVRAERMAIEAFLMEQPILGGLMFTAGYALVVALSIPVASVLTVLAGFLFGTFVGTLLVVLGATLGAAALFLLVRFFFRDFFAARFGSRLALLDRELVDNGFRDVLLLRLTPVVPFALINIGTALTGVRFRDYVFATLIGIAPFSFVYVHAGTRLAELEQFSDIVAPQTLIALSLVALAIFVSALIRSARRRGG